MRSVWTVVAIAMFCATIGASRAQTGTAPGIFKSGDDIYRACTSTLSADRAACDGFLMGAHDMAALFRDTGAIDADRFCVPGDVSVDRLRDAVIGRWRENPKSREHSAVSALFNALVERFPGGCG